MRKLNKKQDKAIKILTEWMLEFYCSNRNINKFRNAILAIRTPHKFDEVTLSEYLTELKYILFRNYKFMKISEKGKSKKDDLNKLNDMYFILINFDEIFDYKVPHLTIVKDQDCIDDEYNESYFIKIYLEDL